MMVSMFGRRLVGAAAVVLAMASGQQASAEDALKIASGQRGNWDTSISELGMRSGIMKKHGLSLEILWTQGSGETQQALISGAVDIGIAIGTLGAVGAYSKGAPVRIIGAQTTGAADLYWYVRADSPIKDIRGNAGKTIAYSTNGSSTQTVVKAFADELGTKATPTATGSPAATLTQVMSGQIDIGWSAPPLGLDLITDGKIRKIATGNDTSLKDQTVRVVATTADKLKTRKDAIDRYMQAYRETVDYMYTNPDGLKQFAEWLNISPETAKRTRDEFFPREAVDPDNIKGIDKIVQDSVAFKFASAPLTKDQLADLIQIQGKK
jgi:NitT/TauT family transport system substrate-binding protein